MKDDSSTYVVIPADIMWRVKVTNGSEKMARVHGRWIFWEYKEGKWYLHRSYDEEQCQEWHTGPWGTMTLNDFIKVAPRFLGSGAGQAHNIIIDNPKLEMRRYYLFNDINKVKKYLFMKCL